MVDERRRVEYVERPDEPVVVREDDYAADYIDEPEVSPGWFLARRIAYLLLDVLEILLAFRFVFKLLAANPASPFTAFIYGVTEPLVAPFQGIFGQPAAGGAVVEWATLLAMAVYALVVWGIMRLIWIVVASSKGAESRHRHALR